MMDRRTLIASIAPTAAVSVLPRATEASPLSPTLAQPPIDPAMREVFLRELWHDIETHGQAFLTDCLDHGPWLTGLQTRSAVEDKALLGVAFHLRLLVGTLLDCSTLATDQRRAVLRALAALASRDADPKTSN